MRLPACPPRWRAIGLPAELRLLQLHASIITDAVQVYSRCGFQASMQAHPLQVYASAGGWVCSSVLVPPTPHTPHPTPTWRVDRYAFCTPPAADLLRIRIRIRLARSATAVSVELRTIRTTHDWTFHPSVMLANALTAFILNLVRPIHAPAVCLCA